MPTDANLDDLLNKLVHGEFQEQIGAYVALSQIGESAVLPLMDLLKNHENASIWSMIADSLNFIGDKRAVEPLIERLAELNRFNERHSARKSIVMALGNLKDLRAVDVLLEALNHRLYEEGDDGNLYEEYDEETVEAIEWALTAIGDPRALEPVFEKILVDWYQDAELLLEWGEPAFQLLMTELKSNAHNRDSNAASLLGDFKDVRAVEPIIELLLTHEDNSARGTAAQSLGQIKDLRALDPLIATLKNPHAWTRSQAAMALGLLGDKRATEPLRKALEDEDNQVHSAASTAIKRIENPDAFKMESRRNGEGSEKIFEDLIIGEDWFKGENKKE